MDQLPWFGIRRVWSEVPTLILSAAFMRGATRGRKEMRDTDVQDRANDRLMGLPFLRPDGRFNDDIKIDKEIIKICQGLKERGSWTPERKKETPHRAWIKEWKESHS